MPYHIFLAHHVLNAVHIIWLCARQLSREGLLLFLGQKSLDMDVPRSVTGILFSHLPLCFLTKAIAFFLQAVLLLCIRSTRRSSSRHSVSQSAREDESA